MVTHNTSFLNGDQIGTKTKTISRTLTLTKFNPSCHLALLLSAESSKRLRIPFMLNHSTKSMTWKYHKTAQSQATNASSPTTLPQSNGGFKTANVSQIIQTRKTHLRMEHGFTFMNHAKSKTERYIA